ncbi:MAG TPA: FAD-dependent oxidoreductase [Candidatus Dormibacteraeota bacterium]|nr:FAD-dependent oxidoreductase [Candidatus Dormibacteraeota bacterium]
MGAVVSADRYDLVVIGGGSAGLTAAAFAAQVGASVLIATERLGGDCTWTGCIPSKALIRVARQAHDGRSVDFATVMAEVHAAIERVYSYETADALEKLGIEVSTGPVRFLDGESVQAGNRRVRADHFIVCTGAAPFVPPIPGLEGTRHLTYETVFDLDLLPESLIVVGAGATGVELGQAFARLGSRVTLIDQASSVLPDADPEACALIQHRLVVDGIDVQLSAEVNRVASEAGRVLVAAGSLELQAEALLLATGRKPRTVGLELDRAGIDIRDAAITVDMHLRTSNPRVFAAGDVTGGFQFTHYAGWQGYVAARNALLPGGQDGIKANIPWAVFTDPEVAQAGLSEAGARSQFDDVLIHRLQLERVDRAQTEDERDGFLKLVTRAGGKVLGAVVVSRAAGETINELALAIERGLSVSDLASTIHAYPTFGFGVQQLAAQATFEAAASGIRGKALRALRRLS